MGWQYPQALTKWGHVTAWDQEKRQTDSSLQRQKDRALRKLVWEQTLSEETELRGRGEVLSPQAGVEMDL